MYNIIAYTGSTVTDIIIYNIFQCYLNLLHPSGRLFYYISWCGGLGVLYYYYYYYTQYDCISVLLAR